MTSSPEQTQQEARRTRTVWWILTLATVGLIFDGYDLVVYGAVVSTFLRDASQIGPVTPPVAGALGSYALFGVALGALLAGSVGDIIGRRKVMLASYAWFSVGMACTALAQSTQTFGWMRFVTGLGIGSLVATTAALVAEYAPRDKKNLFIAISNGGIPLGSMLSAILAMVLMQHIGWRGMFWIGALPLVTLLPLAYFKMPESVAWLAARGRLEEKRRIRRHRHRARRCRAKPSQRLCRSVWRLLPVAHAGAGLHERHRLAAGVFAQHLAARTHAARRL